MMKHLLRAATLLVAFFSFQSAFAFRMSPMVVHYDTDGRSLSRVIVLESQDSEKIPIQFEAFTRSTGPDGKEVREKTTDFTIYPEQLVLLPGEKRNIRVTWAGDFGADKIEKAYRIIASQLPVEFQDQNAKAKKAAVNLNFLLQYIASAYATPKGSSSKIKVAKTEFVEPKKIAITFTNDGTAHQVLHVKSFKLKGGGKDLLDLKAVPDIESVNVLAKSQMRVIVNLPQAIQKQDLQTDLELTEIKD